MRECFLYIKVTIIIPHFNTSTNKKHKIIQTHAYMNVCIEYSLFYTYAIGESRYKYLTR